MKECDFDGSEGFATYLKFLKLVSKRLDDALMGYDYRANDDTILKLDDFILRAMDIIMRTECALVLTALKDFGDDDYE